MGEVNKLEGSATLDTNNSDQQYQEDTDPAEQLNPWASIIYRPRETIRFILDNGVWDNIWLIFAFIWLGMIPGIVVSMFLQPENSQLFADLPMLAMVAIFIGAYFILGYPFTMLFIYFTGWLYGVIGRALGGGGVARDMRIAITWTYVISLYSGWVMLLPNGALAFIYQTSDLIDHNNPFTIVIIQFIMSLPIMILYMVVGAKCVGEAHQFSAWRGLGSILISWIIMMVMYIGFIICVFLLFLLILGLAGAGS
jgi:hypothetical protein